MPYLTDDDGQIPYQGLTPDATKASLSGAQLAAASRAVKTAAYLELLKFHGPLTDHDAAKRLGVGLSTINSVRGTLISRAARKRELPPVVAAGTVKITFGYQRFSYRTLWRIA
jgi:hypothetical protein